MTAAKRHFYLNSDRTKVVEEGADAAFLLVATGSDIDEQIGTEFGADVLKQLKAANTDKVETKFEVVEEKAVPAPPENKAVRSAKEKESH